MINTSATQELMEMLEGGRKPLPVGPVINIHIALRALHEGTSLADIVEAARGQLEHHLIQQTLISTCGNKSEAARVLRIDYKTLYRKLRKYAKMSLQVKPGYRCGSVGQPLGDI